MANRYWVGGTATWDGTAGSKWATTSGGAGGSAAPTAADDVFLDAASGVVTVTLSAVFCRSLNCTSFTGTLSHPAATTLTIGDGTAGAGNVALLLVAGMTYTLGGTSSSSLTFVSTSATQQTLTFGGKTTGNIFLQGVGSSYLYTDAHTTAAAVTLTQGIFNTGNQTCSWGQFLTSNSNVRTLTLGSSAITLTLVGGNGMIVTNTNLTITTNTAVATLTGGTGTGISVALATNFNGLSLVANGAGSFVLTAGGCTFANFTRTGTAAKTDSLNVASSAGGSNVTVTGTLTLTSNSDVNRLLVQSNTVGSARTLTAATVVITNTVDFMDITGDGAATWTVAGTGATALGDAGGNSGITFTTPATQTWSGTSGGNWSANAWTSRVPLPQDDVVVSAAFAAQIITLDMPRLGASINFAGSTGLTLNDAVANAAFGSLALAAGVTLANTRTTTLSGRGSHTITSAGKTFVNTITIAAVGGSYTLQDALATIGPFNMNAGTFTANNFAVTALTFASSPGAGVVVVINMGTGTWTLTSAALTTIWSVAPGITVNASTSTIVLPAASTSSRTFGGGGKAYGTLTYNVANSPGPLVITGANTFTALNVGPGRTLTMPSSTVTTIGSAAGWNVNGSPNGYEYFPGVAGNYASVPDSAALSVTGDIDIRLRLTLDDWTPASAVYPFSKYTEVNGERSYLLSVQTAGTLRLYGSTDGTNAPSVISSAATGISDGSVAWLRVTRVAATGVAKFYTSTTNTNDPNAVSWTQLGTDQTFSTFGNVFDGPAPLIIGAYNGGTGGPIAGKVYRAAIYGVIGGSTPIFDADFTTKAFGVNTFTESSSNAATVTINGTLAQAGDGRVSLVSSTGGSAATLSSSIQQSVDYLSIQDSTVNASPKWYAGANSVNVSGNTNWIFTGPPKGNFFGLF